MVPKRICIVTHTFLPHVGGIERVAYEQGKRLMQRGYEVTVVTSRMNTAKSYFIGEIRVRCYDSLNVGFGVGIPYSVPSFLSLKTFLENVHSSDLVHVHGHPYLSSLFAAKLAKRNSKPVVLTQHNTFISYSGSFWDHIEWLNDSTVGKQVLKSSDRIIAVSNATKKYVLSLGADPERTSVLHNGVDTDRFKPSTRLREETRRKLSIPEDATVVLSVRRLVYKNGIDTLIDSAETAIKKNPKLVFLAVGKGPDFDAVKSKISQLGIAEKFKLAGFVPDAELPAYYNAADLFVLPSKSGEGLPLVGLEAMSCGLPVIATNVGGISEIMTEGAGRLVPPNSPPDMAEAILEYSRKELGPIKTQLRTIAEQRFSWDRNVERLTKTYEELI